MKTPVKNGALTASRAAGAFWVTRHLPARRSKLLILCYHGLSLRDEHEWAGHLFITPERFRERLACLRRLGADVLPLEEATVRLGAGSLPPRSVAITFDDGFYDFLSHGVPILQEFQFPCTLYLTTHYVGRPYPISNLALDYLLWKSRLAEAAFPDQGMMLPLPIRDWRARAEVVRGLVGWLEERNFDSAAKNEFVRTVAARLDVDYEDLIRSRALQLLTEQETLQVSRAGIDIQLHTHRHRTPRVRELFIREIEDNRSRIAAITGRVPKHFCYPSGVHAQEFLPWLRECGVMTATTCERGFAGPTSEPLLLPRLLDDSNMSLVQFEAFVSGFLI